jgi:hypothetical protein
MTLSQSIRHALFRSSGRHFLGDDRAAFMSGLTALSVLAALVFGARLVVLVAEALDAYHGRWR